MAYALTDRAVRKLTEIIQGQRGNKGGGGTHGASAWIDDFPLPFTVRWSATANNWVIWLPSISGLVCVDGDGVTITGASAAQSLPSGWYTVSGVSGSSTAVYLNITIPDEDQTGVTTTAALSGTASSSSTGNKVYPLTVATMATDSSTGAKTVRQSLCSAVALSSDKNDTVDVDDISIEEAQIGGTGDTGDEVLQIKDFHTSAADQTDTLAENLFASSESSDMILVRTSDGALKYKHIGTLYDSQARVSVVGAAKYDTTSHQLQVRMDEIYIDNDGKLAISKGTGTMDQNTGPFSMIPGGQAVAHSTV